PSTPSKTNMIGLSTTKPVIDTGSFDCPKCHQQRSYQRKLIKNWISIYFIPIIPIGASGEVLQCTKCKIEFPAKSAPQSQASDSPTSEDFAEALLVLVALDRGTPNRKVVAKLQQVLSELREQPVSSETVAALILQGQSTRYSAFEYARTTRAGISREDRIRAVVLIDELVRCPGEAHPAGLDLLDSISKALGISSTALNSLLGDLET
ncbi:MAG: zinc-ribbon domain-containing protein, partial [Planctomycetota bacterium]|nr:zinc-ribbon domain-containing protein [Planctomycetota bacterium]